MKRTSILLLLSCMLFSSCEFLIAPHAEGNVNLVSVALRYPGLAEEYQLKYTIADAISFSSVLQKLYGSRMGTTIALYDTGTSDGMPTKGKVEAACSSLGETAKANDLIFFYYSGHGNENGEPLLDDGEYALGSLLRKLDEIPGKKVIIMDSCYSGKAAEAYGCSASTGVSLDVWTPYFSDASYGLNDLFVLSSSTSETKSLESGIIGHGYFTYHLIKGLGWTSDDAALSAPPAISGKNVTLGSLQEYIKKACLTERIVQRPTVNGTTDDIVLYGGK